MSSQIWRLGRKCFARTMLYVHVYKRVFGDRHLGTLNRTYIDLSSLLTRPVDRPPVKSSMLAAFSKLRTTSTIHVSTVTDTCKDRHTDVNL